MSRREPSAWRSTQLCERFQLSVNKPFGMGGFAFDDLGPRGEPFEFASGLCPELFGLFDAAAIHGLVFCKALYMCLCGKFSRRGKQPILPQT